MSEVDEKEIREFCKIMVFENEQILFQKDFDIEDDKFELRATIDSDIMGALISISAKYNAEESREQKFLELEKGLGEEFYKAIKALEGRGEQ